MADEKIEAADEPKQKAKKRNPLLVWFIPWLIAFFGWALVVAKDTVQAQVMEDVKAVHALPVTQLRIDHLEKDVDDIRKDIHEQRTDLKYLIRRFDTKYHGGR